MKNFWGKFKSFTQSVRIFFLKTFSFNLRDIIHLLINGLISYVPVAILVFLPLYIKANWDHKQFSYFDWLCIFGGPLLVVTFNYLKEKRLTKNRDKKIKEEEISYRCIAGAIDQLADLWKRKHKKEIVFSQILQDIEKVVTQTLKMLKIETKNITANLMLYSPKKNVLTLRYFGTRLDRRTSLVLPLDKGLPGATAAFVTKEIVYIENTQSPEYNHHFSISKSYRSIISYPIQNNRKIYAILNIDSENVNQFVSNEFITIELLPKMQPFIALLRFTGCG